MNTQDRLSQRGDSTASPRATLEESDQITGTVERSMRLLAVIGRIVGWVWMLMLVIATLKVDTEANDRDRVDGSRHRLDPVLNVGRPQPTDLRISPIRVG